MKGLRQGGLPQEEYTEVGKDIEEGIAAAKILVNAGYDALNVDAAQPMIPGTGITRRCILKTACTANSEEF